jgi:hypothetical protein
MSPDNGQKPLLFKGPNVPIVGQPFAIRGWFPTVLLQCNCSAAHEAIMIPRGAAGQCPACKKVYAIQQVVMTPDGQITFGIGIMVADADPADVPKPSIFE